MRVQQTDDGRVRVFSDSPFETLGGYCRALRTGNTVVVSGTTAMQRGEPFAPGDAAAQTRFVLEVIDQALNALGARLADVVRYRVYLVDMGALRDVALELGRVFADVRPVSSLVGISALADPRLLVEIEVDAVTR